MKKLYALEHHNNQNIKAHNCPIIRINFFDDGKISLGSFEGCRGVASDQEPLCCYRNRSTAKPPIGIPLGLWFRNTPHLLEFSCLLSQFSNHFMVCPSFPSQWPREALNICFKSFGCRQEKRSVCDVIMSLCLQTTQREIISLVSCILWDPPAPKWSSEEKLWSWSASLRACKSALSICSKRKTAEIALKSILVFVFLSMTDLLQISPGRRMEESSLAVEYPFRPSRKHSRFPMWWKLTLESTAARPQTGWVPHTTSLKSPWKVRSHYGVMLWRKVPNTAPITYSWSEIEMTAVWIFHILSSHSCSILGQRSEEPDPRAEWDRHPDLPSRGWAQTEDYLVYQRCLHRKWVKWAYFPFTPLHNISF